MFVERWQDIYVVDFDDDEDCEKEEKKSISYLIITERKKVD